MLNDQLKKALLGELKRVWLPTMGLVSWPNVDFKTPSDKMWSEVFVMEYGTERASLGSDSLRRHYGSLQVNIYSPAGVGSSENRIVSDILESHFDDLIMTLADEVVVNFGTPDSRDIVGRANPTKGNWFQRVCDCPFYMDYRVAK